MATLKINFSLRLIGLFIIGGQPLFARENTARLHETFDFGWKFFKGDATNAENISFADNDWQKLPVVSTCGAFVRMAPASLERKPLTSSEMKR